MRLLLIVVLVLIASEWSSCTGTNLPDNDADINSILTCDGDPLRIGLGGGFRGLDEQNLPELSKFNGNFPSGTLSIQTMISLLNAMGPNFMINRTLTRIDEPSPIEVVPNPCDTGAVAAADDQQSPNDIRLFYMTRLLNESISVTTDELINLERILEALECRVAFNWINAGEQFFPRFMVSGGCSGIRCSLPDRSDFLCRPDMSPDQLGFLNAYRYDCCWRNVMSGRRFLSRRFECGWRQVQVPVICDCDCTCGAQEVL